MCNVYIVLYYIYYFICEYIIINMYLEMYKLIQGIYISCVCVEISLA